MTIILRIYKDFTCLYSGDEPIIHLNNLTVRLYVGDIIAFNRFDKAIVKEVVYSSDADSLTINAILDQPYIPLEKEVD